MTAPHKIACIGAGYWGKNLVRNFSDLGVLAWVCDLDPDRRAHLAAAYPMARFTAAVDQVLADPEVAGVVIATPAETHGELVRRALLAGKDVLVEKPLCLSVEEGQKLVALACERQRVLMVGHLLWYHPAVLKLRELVEEGELGRIQYIYSHRLNLGKIRQEENILWSFAPHDISVILLLVGTLPEWASTSGQHYLQHDVADVTMTCLAFPGKARAHIFVSWLHPFKEQKLVVVGSRKMAVFDDVIKEGKLKIFDKAIEWKDGRPVIRQTAESTLFFPEMEPLREELGHFLDCVHHRKTPRTDGENGVRVLRVLDACQRSIGLGGQPVRL